MKLVDGTLAPVAAPVALPESSCVVCGNPAEDDLPWCSLACEGQSKYQDDVQWQESQAAKKEEDDEDEIQQLMRLRL
jgi:hypothetical protein